MGATLDRLDEMRFFLHKLKKNYGKKEFDHYLNAFMASARSVLWIMHAEYSNKDGWEAWYQKKEPTESEKRLLDLITELRNTSQKIKPLKSHFEREFTIPAEYASEDLIADLQRMVGKSGTLMLSDEESAEVLTGSIAVKAKFEGISGRKIDSITDEPILDVCQQYSSQIGNVVDECVKKFG